MIRLALMFAAVAGIAGSASAQNCPSPKGWASPARHAAAKTPQLRFGLKPDTSAQLALHAQPTVKLATKAKAGTAKRYAGLAALDVAKPGKIDVLLSSRAYVDLVRGTATLKSIDHRHAGCNGVFKVVSFDVKPGRHVVQITDSEAPSIRFATITR